MNKFKIFSASVALKPLYKIGDHSTYGSLVRTLDLSMLGGRWEKLGFKDLAPVFECCTSMKGIDLGLCQHIKDAQMIKLFEDNPHLSTNIIHLNLDEVMLTDETLAKIVRMLPSLQQLDIAETHAGYDTCAAIGDCLPNLKSLVLEDCEDIDDECIEKIAKGCTDLAYLKIRGCTSILTDSVGDILMEYDNFAVVSEGSGDDYENDDMYEDGEYPYEDYNYNDYDSDEDDYYDDYYEDNKDDDED
ncbi:hypothetical protein EV175_004069 [Coemansia sp. RSA 1933]|nr:hypothetical protein EV175_004069 [Coemansia sp. RSA 1933]